MKESEVPQEGNSVLEGERKAMYALNDQGEYTLVPSRGWEVEEIVTTMAVDALKQHAEQARASALAGRSSPLEFHMYQQRMDLAILSQSTGIAKWRIRRHLRPKVFAGLKARLLQRYADALGITVAQLRSVESK